MKRFFYLVICTIVLGACQGRRTNPAEQQKNETAQLENYDFEAKVKYAGHFIINNHKGYKYIVVFDPWNSCDTLASYVLYPKSKPVPPNLPAHEFLIPVPINTIGSMSTPNIGSLSLLGELEKVVGISDGKLISNTHIREKFQKGQLSELGAHQNSNIEEIINLSPDLLIKTGFDNVRKLDERLVEAGIPLAYNVEWMESHMLGRAEWIKFTGAFFAKDALADSIFNSIEKSFSEQLQLISQIEKRPSVMLGFDSKGTWYTPGGKSYVGKLIEQCGGAYMFRNDKTQGSQPLSFEVMLDWCVDADIWLMNSYTPVSSIKNMDERFQLFKAVREGNVYNFDNRLNEDGGNDYWESGVTRPDIVMKDVIKMFHPELLPDHDLYYYRKVPRD